MKTLKAITTSIVLLLITSVNWAETTDETHIEPLATDTAEKSEPNASHQPSLDTLRYTCVLQDLERRIEIDYLHAITPLPCEVNYYKDVETPGIKQTLWRAESLAGYCEQQAEHFVGKLQGWGWNCTTQK